MSGTGSVKGEKAGLAARVYTLVERAAKDGRRCPTDTKIATELNKSGLTRAAAGSITGIFRQLIR